jgi:hypothetical protein
MSSWRNDIQSLVKKCRILALYFFPQVLNRCRVSDQRPRGYRVHVDRCIACRGTDTQVQGIPVLRQIHADKNMVMVRGPVKPTLEKKTFLP